MKSRILGQTGLVVSRMGLGLAALGRPGYINLGHRVDLGGGIEPASMEAVAYAVLDAALEGGVQYFDAVRSYGRAESFLANWLALRKIAAGAVTVGSKWGYTYTADWKVDAKVHEEKDLSLKTLTRQAAESRQILGAHLNLYQIHSATLESGVLENRDVHNELAKLRGAGLRIGLTVTGPHQPETLRRALEVAVDGKPLFDCVQATWDVLEQSAGSALAEAHAAGRGVIVKEALANGRLTERNDEPAFAAKRKLLAEAATRLGVSLDALALAAVLAQPWADVVLSGAANVPQLRSNLAAEGIAWDRPLDEFLPALAESAEDYWQTRSRLPWN